MNPHASLILDMPVRHAIGTRIKFRSQKTLRTKSGTISHISPYGVRVTCRRSLTMFAPWDAILEINNSKA